MNLKLRQILSEETPITISMMLVVIGGVLWLSAMDAAGKANTKALEELRADQTKYVETLLSIDRRLANIEGRLE